MAKKILFTIAVVAFLTTSVRAIDPVNPRKFDAFWPYEYIAVPICVIPIVIDVGYFVQLDDCGGRKIKLVQVACDTIGKSNTDNFPCYKDCETIKLRANFEVKLGANIINKAAWWGDGSAYYESPGPGIIPDVVPGDGAWHERKVCVNAWNVKVWSAPMGDEISIARLEITVKPNTGPVWP